MGIRVPWKPLPYSSKKKLGKLSLRMLLVGERQIQEIPTAPRCTICDTKSISISSSPRHLHHSLLATDSQYVVIFVRLQSGASF